MNDFRAAQPALFAHAPNEGHSALGVGPFFAMVHSSVVIVMSMAISMAAISLTSRFEEVKAYGGIISASVSAFFVLLLAVANASVLMSVYKTFRAVRRGEALVEEDLDLLLNQRGVLAKFFGPLFRLASRSWHCFPIGVLFGSGLWVWASTPRPRSPCSASPQPRRTTAFRWARCCRCRCFRGRHDPGGYHRWRYDDGAYRWAFVRPIRKIYYNMMITLVARVIGGVQALALAVDKLSLSGPSGLHRHSRFPLRNAGIFRHRRVSFQLDRLSRRLSAEAL